MKHKQSPLSDELLVEQFRAGNNEAFGFLFSRYRTIIIGILVSKTGDLNLAKDILQDTSVKAMLALTKGEYTEIGSMKYWLIRIANNLCMDYFRKKKKHASAFSIDSSDKFGEDSNGHVSAALPSHDDNPEAVLIGKQSDYDMQEFLDKLPEEQKEVVVLRIYHELSFAEIAQYTDVTINTALGRMRYALMNLRKMIVRKQS